MQMRLKRLWQQYGCRPGAISRKSKTDLVGDRLKKSLAKGICKSLMTVEISAGRVIKQLLSLQSTDGDLWHTGVSFQIDTSSARLGFRVMSPHARS
jgi:hypothetical protein